LPRVSSARDRGGWFAGAAALGAVVASSCCIGPLLLVILGVSGAWIGNLVALEPYKPYFLVVTALLLGAGFWQVYFRPRPACAEDSYCARPGSATLTKSVLWGASALALAAATVSAWAPWFY
jgi:mercuric ion transport protein